MKLSSLHQETGHVSNLSVVCGDGMLASHKIVLAGVSTFIKNILADIPVGDQVTVIMPDFCVDEMEEFLQMIISEKVSDNFPLCSAFGQPVRIPFTPRKEPSYLQSSSHLKEECLSEVENVEVEENIVKNEETILSDDDIDDTTNMGEEDDFGDTDAHTLSEKKLPSRATKVIAKIENYKKDNPIIRDGRSARKSTVDHAAIVMANFPNIEQRMEDSIKDLIANPSCLEDKRKNERTKMQIKVIEAVTYLSRTGEGLRKVAAKFGVKKSTLHRAVLGKIPHLTGDQRGAKKRRVFSPEEEMRLVARAKEMSDGGTLLTPRLLENMLNEELSFLRINHPDDQKLSQGFSRKYVRNFAKRFNLLTAYENERKRKKASFKNECDVCGKMFSTPKNCLDHKKSVHFPFLHANCKYAKKTARNELS